MTITETLWPLEPHTRGKHQVLRRYLQAWYPILASWQGRVLFIDGFAGPGEYAGHEDGSPLIAIKTMAEHDAASKLAAEAVFLFIEKDKARADHLRGLLKPLEGTLPKKFCWEVVEGEFDAHMGYVLDLLEKQQTKLAPCFVMIDPFGVSGTPMSVTQRIFRNPRSEVYVSVMYEWINRFKGEPAFEKHLDDLFGCEDWRAAIGIADVGERKSFLCGLYERQLRIAGAKHVVHFDLYEGERLVYSIFYGTQSAKGCNAMKEAIWKVDPIEGAAFRGSKSPQLRLNLGEPDFTPLRRALKTEFGGKGWVPRADVEYFVMSDRTEYYLSQLRGGALIPMEESGELEVTPPQGKKRKKNTYPEGVLLRFTTA
jgi:three-Cys-motif partner protein